VPQAARDDRFVLEPGEELLVVGEQRAHDLDGEGLAEGAVPGAIDDRHPAGADLVHDLVLVPDGRPGRELVQAPPAR
jgi:hypothetical protein